MNVLRDGDSSLDVNVGVVPDQCDTVNMDFTMRIRCVTVEDDAYGIFCSCYGEDKNVKFLSFECCMSSDSTVYRTATEKRLGMRLLVGLNK